MDYNEDLQRLTKSVDAFTSSQLGEVSRSVDTGDTTAINRFLDRLLRHRGTAYAAVSVGDKIAWEQGEKLTRKYLYSTYSLPLMGVQHGSAPKLEVLTDIQPIYNDFILRFVNISIANGLKIFLTAGFVFLMFQYLVNRHLESLAKQISKQDYQLPYAPIVLDRSSGEWKDELDQVISGVNRMHSNAHDAIQSLARNEKRLLLFFDSTEEAVLGVDRNGVCNFANSNFLETLGVESSSQIVGKEYERLFFFVDLDNQDVAGGELIRKSMEQMKPLQSNNGELISAIGGGRREKQAVSLRCYPVVQEGSVSGAITFIKDESETKKLRHERELLGQAVEQLPVMVIILSPESEIQFVNHGVEHLTGYNREELLGQSIFDFTEISADNTVDRDGVQGRVLDGKQWEGVVRAVAKSSVVLNLYCVLSPVFNDQGKITNSIAVCREISYELALQNELINTKKMEAVGRLSASFAHEFGNPLFGVYSVLKDVSMRVDFAAEDRRLLHLAQLECEKMRDMVREFQEQYRHSRVGKINMSAALVLQEVLDEVLPMIDGDQIRTELSLSSEADTLIVNKSRFSLAVRNIIVNAIESMNGGGGTLKIKGVLEDEFFKFLISDCGTGIIEEHQDLIFEPFFSTKSTMEGAGLGLSFAYSAVKSLGGNITFVCEEDKGTTFQVSIPFP